MLTALLFPPFAESSMDLGGPLFGGGVLGSIVAFLLIYDRPRMQKEHAASLALIVDHLEEKDYLINLMAVSPDIKNDQAIKDFLKASAERIGSKRRVT